MMSRTQNWPFSLQVLYALATLLGGMTMLIRTGWVPIQTVHPPDIVTHGHVMRMDILWYLILTALVYCGDMMACWTRGICASSCFARQVSPRKHLTVFGYVTCANWHSCSQKPVAEPLVIQKMDLCSLDQQRPYDLTGICRLIMANWISLRHGDKCGRCEIHCHQCLCPQVQLKAGTTKKLWNSYRSFMLLLTEISKASSSRMVSCLYTPTATWMVYWYDQIISHWIREGPTYGGFQFVWTKQDSFTTSLHH